MSDIKPFPQSKAYELALVRKGGNLAALRRYLQPFISKAIEHVGIPVSKRPKVRRDIDEDIFTAAARYINHKSYAGKYKFSSYFSWYLSKRVNQFSETKTRKK